MAEHLSVEQDVAGSTPVSHPKSASILRRFSFGKKTGNKKDSPTLSFFSR